jgi:hypothetical protein
MDGGQGPVLWIALPDEKVLILGPDEAAYVKDQIERYLSDPGCSYEERKHPSKRE